VPASCRIFLANLPRFYPPHYLEAAHNSQILIQPDIPTKVYIPGCISIDFLIAAGEKATHLALAQEQRMKNSN